MALKSVPKSQCNVDKTEKANLQNKHIYNNFLSKVFTKNPNNITGKNVWQFKKITLKKNHDIFSKNL